MLRLKEVSRHSICMTTKVSWQLLETRKGRTKIKRESVSFNDYERAKQFARELNYQDIIGVPILEEVYEKK